MTVRFKGQSEYQKSYRVSRSRSASPQRCAPLAGLRSDHMGLSREPNLQRRKRPGPGARPLLSPPDPRRDMSSAASRSRSAHGAEPSPCPNPPTPSEPRAEPESPAQPEAPAGPGPAAAEPGPPAGPGPAADPGLVSSAKPRPSHPDSQPQPSPLTAAPDGQQSSANEVDQALRWRAGLRSGGQRSGGHRSEHRRQFRWKKPATSASPILTAERVLYSSSRSIPPFKKNPVAMESEYQRSFQALAPPARPRLLKHLEHQRIPLFHTHTTNKKRREESPKMPTPKEHIPTPQNDDITPPPPQVQKRHRKLTEYESSFRSPLHRIPEEGGAMDGDAPQVRELRLRASSHRRRAWGTHFSRDHLSQLRSEHNALWEATDTATDSASGAASPRLTLDLCQEPDSRGTSCPEALDLVSRSSEADTHTTDNNTATRRQAWEEEEEEEDTDEEEGRLPTPRLKMKPVQRTHHDLTTPASAGGAILVGKVKSGDEVNRHRRGKTWKRGNQNVEFSQRCGSAVSMAAGTDPVVDATMRRTEAWSENNPPHRPSPGPSPSPGHKPACKPIRSKLTPSPLVAPHHQAPPPPHCIQGTLRHPDFQHNGELGSRFRELQCSGDDEDDRLSVMSRRSAASCSVASAVLDRAQKRRENFWGKR
ncbi:nuclear protein MDM1 isoform X3 [Scophthalmus maximus]|uniref:nuclear protein MDM1 isoform X3 n=1 Tax=Scophthalmus maximus TaxID=52904 RepID=UPI001FA8C265|nr:nuclear protein MDM1 isoform X3 [Scophthalmus maximus]